LERVRAVIKYAASVPPPAGAGCPLTVTDTVKNQGSNMAGNSTTSFYLSTNFSLDAGDKLLGSRNVPTLQPGQTNSGSTTFTIPADTELGQYFILVSADDPNVV